MIYTTPTTSVRQLSGKDPGGRHILSVVFKATYAIRADGQCVMLEEPAALVEAPEDGPCKTQLGHDSDLYPFKPGTDLVVKGHAYGYTGRPTFHAMVGIEQYAFYLLVTGARQCTLDRYGRPLFSAPAPVDKVPLDYTAAYGGIDTAAAAKYGHPAADVFKMLTRLDMSRVNPYRYPRNPCGRGYLVELTPEGVEQLSLPQLEDAYDPLTPERLVTGRKEHWMRMPLPYATDWFSYEWFPRVAYFGVLPPCEKPEGPIAEVTRWGVTPDILKPPATNDFAFRMVRGASPGLQLPYLRGGELITLESLHPTRQRVVFRLPSDRPKIWVDGRKGTLKETDPVIHTVVIEPDTDQCTVLWRGSAPALRPYLPTELPGMPLRVAG